MTEKGSSEEWRGTNREERDKDKDEGTKFKVILYSCSWPQEDKEGREEKRES